MEERTGERWEIAALIDDMEALCIGPKGCNLTIIVGVVVIPGFIVGDAEGLNDVLEIAGQGRAQDITTQWALLRVEGDDPVVYLDVEVIAPGYTHFTLRFTKADRATVEMLITNGGLLQVGREEGGPMLGIDSALDVDSVLGIALAEWGACPT